MRISRLSAIAVFVGTVLAGCSTPVAQAPTVAAVSLPPHLDPKSLISRERSVYFDFDVFSIKTEYSGLIERHGMYLASQPTLSIKIEGNTDERGSREYNLALGQKRAQSVLQALKIYGVKDSQMEAVSWGEERPKSTGQNEGGWAENRRADLVYPKQ
ncbi:MAG: peptidoglycan-associated lipoprotein [Burkholderiales bacterium 28-67-8]|nr:MAG: peptidoglycan-associated lipoprotein [Burkholderiales bacterium 28-67-8]